MRQRDVEYEHGPGLHVGDPRGRFPELHSTVAVQQLVALIVNEADAQGVTPDLGPPSPHPEHEVGSGMHRGELRHPHVLEESEHRQLALLVDQRVVGQDREIEQQIRTPGWR